jgi:hypothetical protein
MQKLVSPEFRVYLIGERVLAFRLQSPSLDYREKQVPVVRSSLSSVRGRLLELVA